MTTIVLADDHHIVRQALRALLETKSDFSIVGEMGDGLEVVRLVEQLRPDVLVVDLIMPSLGGLEVTRQVSKLCPQTAIIVLSMHANEAFVLEALKNGASGYVLKESSSTNLVQAIREVIAGRCYLSPQLSDLDIDPNERGDGREGQDPYDKLTTREREVLHL